MSTTAWVIVGIGTWIGLFVLERIYYLIRWPTFYLSGCHRIRIKTETATLKGWCTTGDDLFWSTDFDVAFEFKEVSEKKWQWLRTSKTKNQFLAAAKKAKQILRDPQGYMAAHPPTEEELLEHLKETEADIERLAAAGKKDAEYDVLIDQKINIIDGLFEIRKKKRQED